MDEDQLLNLLGEATKQLTLISAHLKNIAVAIREYADAKESPAPDNPGKDKERR